MIDDSHATVAWGRDYGDVPPVKGVIFTEAKKSTMKVCGRHGPRLTPSPDDPLYRLRPLASTLNY